MLTQKDMSLHLSWYMGALQDGCVGLLDHPTAALWGWIFKVGHTSSQASPELDPFSTGSGLNQTAVGEGCLYENVALIHTTSLITECAWAADELQSLPQTTTAAMTMCRGPMVPPGFEEGEKTPNEWRQLQQSPDQSRDCYVTTAPPDPPCWPRVIAHTPCTRRNIIIGRITLRVRGQMPHKRLRALTRSAKMT